MAGDHAQPAHPGMEQLPGLDAELYESLRELARFHLRAQRGDITLNCTALVHEAYLKIVNSDSRPPESANSYTALASLAMRQILVDYIRSKRALKHGGDMRKVTLHDHGTRDRLFTVDFLDIDRAMRALGRHDPYLEMLVTLRFFAGLSIAEAANALGRCTRTIERDWVRARAYLLRELHDERDLED